MIEVELSDQQSRLEIDSDRLVSALRTVLNTEKIRHATISVAIVDDPTIHELNRKYLSHDYATDVLSFLLHEDDDGMEGEVIVSAETAVRVSAEYGWTAENELLLYVIHGTLHLVGYDDRSADEREMMQQRECFHLQALGIASPPRLPDDTPQRNSAENSPEGAGRGNIG